MIKAILFGIAVWYLVGLIHLIFLIYKDGWKIGPQLIVRNLPTRTKIFLWFAIIVVGPFMVIYLTDESETLHKSKEIHTDEILNNCWASKPDKEIL